MLSEETREREEKGSTRRSAAFTKCNMTMTRCSETELLGTVLEPPSQSRSQRREYGFTTGRDHAYPSNSVQGRILTNELNLSVLHIWMIMISSALKASGTRLWLTVIVVGSFTFEKDFTRTNAVFFQYVTSRGDDAGPVSIFLDACWHTCVTCQVFAIYSPCLLTELLRKKKNRWWWEFVPSSLHSFLFSDCLSLRSMMIMMTFLFFALFLSLCLFVSCQVLVPSCRMQDVEVDVGDEDGEGGDDDRDEKLSHPSIRQCVTMAIKRSTQTENSFSGLSEWLNEEGGQRRGWWRRAIRARRRRDGHSLYPRFVLLFAFPSIALSSFFSFCCYCFPLHPIIIIIVTFFPSLFLSLLCLFHFHFSVWLIVSNLLRLPFSRPSFKHGCVAALSDHQPRCIIICLFFVCHIVLILIFVVILILIILILFERRK